MSASPRRHERTSGYAATGRGSPDVLGDGLHRLGGWVDVDGRLSWFAPDRRGIAPVNCYLFVVGSAVLLVDTGPPVVEAELLEQLRLLVPADAVMSVLPTRPVEFDSIGNIGAVLDAFHARYVWSDMPMQHLAGYAPQFVLPPEEADATWPPDAGVEWAPFPLVVEVDPSRPGARSLECIRPQLRMLMTAWPYDAASRTLFTSDMFSHVLSPREGAWELTDQDEDELTTQDVADHHLAKHHWLAQADGQMLAEELAAVLADHDIENIAPSFGCVLRGGEVVRRHIDLLLGALRSFPREKG